MSVGDKHDMFLRRRVEVLSEARNLAHTAIAEGRARKTWNEKAEVSLSQLLGYFEILCALKPPEGEDAFPGMEIIEKSCELIKKALSEGKTSKTWNGAIEADLESLIVCIDELEKPFPAKSLAEQDLNGRPVGDAADRLAKKLGEEWPEGE